VGVRVGLESRNRKVGVRDGVTVSVRVGLGATVGVSEGGIAAAV
jgi:hypothetical protein